MKLVLAIVLICFFDQTSYTLYADRRHDDTKAFQAFLDDKPVYYESGEPVGNEVRGKALLFTGTLYLRGGRVKRVRNCFFQFAPSVYRHWQGTNFTGTMVGNIECDQTVQCQYQYDKWKLNRTN